MKTYWTGMREGGGSCSFWEAASGIPDCDASASTKALCRLTAIFRGLWSSKSIICTDSAPSLECHARLSYFSVHYHMYSAPPPPSPSTPSLFNAASWLREPICRPHSTRHPVIHFSIFHSFGAAHCVAQCCRWKTRTSIRQSTVSRSRSARRCTDTWRDQHTFLDAVFLWPLVVLLALRRGGHALDALVEVVLRAGALGRVGALCSYAKRSAR